jgi:hypothetical protein
MNRRVFVALLLGAGVVFLPVQGLGDDPPPKSPSQPTYQLRTSAIGAAGGPTQNSGFQQQGTLAQPTPVGTPSFKTIPIRSIQLPPFATP